MKFLHFLLVLIVILPVELSGENDAKGNIIKINFEASIDLFEFKKQLIEKKTDASSSAANARYLDEIQIYNAIDLIDSAHFVKAKRILIEANQKNNNKMLQKRIVSLLQFIKSYSPKKKRNRIVNRFDTVSNNILADELLYIDAIAIEKRFYDSPNKINIRKIASEKFMMIISKYPDSNFRFKASYHLSRLLQNSGDLVQAENTIKAALLNSSLKNSSVCKSLIKLYHNFLYFEHGSINFTNIKCKN